MRERVTAVARGRAHRANTPVRPRGSGGARSTATLRRPPPRRRSRRSSSRRPRSRTSGRPARPGLPARSVGLERSPRTGRASGVREPRLRGSHARPARRSLRLRGLELAPRRGVLDMSPAMRSLVVGSRSRAPTGRPRAGAPDLRRSEAETRRPPPDAAPSSTRDDLAPTWRRRASRSGAPRGEDVRGDPAARRGGPASTSRTRRRRRRGGFRPGGPPGEGEGEGRDPEEQLRVRLRHWCIPSTGSEGEREPARATRASSRLWSSKARAPARPASGSSTSVSGRRPGGWRAARSARADSDAAHPSSAERIRRRPSRGRGGSRSTRRSLCAPARPARPRRRAPPPPRPRTGARRRGRAASGRRRRRRTRTRPRRARSAHRLEGRPGR